MKHYIDPVTQQVFAYEADGSQFDQVEPGLLPVPAADLTTLLEWIGCHRVTDPVAVDDGGNLTADYRAKTEKHQAALLRLAELRAQQQTLVMEVARKSPEDFLTAEQHAAFQASIAQIQGAANSQATQILAKLQELEEPLAQPAPPADGASEIEQAAYDAANEGYKQEKAAREAAMSALQHALLDLHEQTAQSLQVVQSQVTEAIEAGMRAADQENMRVFAQRADELQMQITECEQEVRAYADHVANPTTVVQIDLAAAKEATKARLRHACLPLLNKLDVDFMRALEDGLDTGAIVSEKRRLRELMKQPDSCTTLEELKALLAA